MIKLNRNTFMYKCNFRKTMGMRNKKRSAFLKALTIIWGTAFILMSFNGCTKGKNEKPKGTVLKLAYAGGLLSKSIMESVIDSFERSHPGITVEMQYIENNYPQKLQTQIAGGTCPDLVWVPDIQFSAYVSKGAFMKLDTFSKNDEKFNLDDYYPQAVEMFKYQDGLYGIPLNCAPLVLQYNKDLFDEAGIKYPVKDWTWDDFLIAAKNLTRDTNGDGRIDQFGFSGPNTIHLMTAFIWQNGGDIFDKKRGISTIDSSASIEAVDFYINLIRKYRVSPNLQESKDYPTYEMYWAGKIGMTPFICPWTPEAIKNQRFRWDVAPLPRRKKEATTFFADGFAIYKGTKYPSEAWELLKYLTGPTGQGIYCKARKIFPTLKKLANSEVFLNPSAPPENKQVFLQAMTHALPLPITPEFSEIDGTIISRQMELALLGQKSAAEACKSMKDGIEELLKKGN